VTGVAGGIGLATARRLSASGYRVFGLDQSAAPEGVELAGYAIIDLGQHEALPVAVERLLEGVEALELLVNNAALQLCAPLEATSVEELRAVLDVNLVAPFALTQHCLARLERARGAVVNVASVHALATSRHIAAYAASKGGLVALTRALALELAGRGVRVNAVLPGAIDTPMLAAGLERAAGAGDAAARLAAFGARHPVGRVGSPDEIASAIEYLADPARASYITGATLVVDGGVTARLSTEVDL
jgi:NAD(P)-dependent dehydrogenase (short-subunit alcohol dehydrogenase family)